MINGVLKLANASVYNVVVVNASVRSVFRPSRLQRRVGRLPSTAAVKKITIVAQLAANC